MRRFANTNYGCKLLFNKVLSRYLESYPFKIDAFYESVAQNQIMSIKISKDQTVHLGINISFKEETMFSGYSDPRVLSIIFRAYFIINYLSCLQAAKEIEPSSYFSGLVTLDAISDLYSNKRNKLCVPNAIKKNKQLRPIDVHCAIGAITRILMDKDLSIADGTAKRCEAYRDILITYTGTPEITYMKSAQAQYAVLREIKIMKSLIAQQPRILHECALFHQVDIVSLDEMNIERLLSTCDMHENRFWPGLILRMLALATKNKVSWQYTNYACMKEAFFDFSSSSMECYAQNMGKSVLLKDTLRAVQYLTRGIEEFAYYDDNAVDGMIHYIR